MSEGFTLHPGADELMRLISGELTAAREAALREHIASCAPCAEALERVETAWAEYREYHERRLKPSIPTPPRPWADLEAPPAISRGERARRRLLPWTAAAAVLLVAIQAYEHFRRPAVVNAAEILRKATAIEERRPRAGRIRIRTSRRSLIRPALAGAQRGGPDAAFEHELQARFAGAHYSWADPLGAGSFSRWRSQLAEKQDAVDEVTDGATSQSLYRIRTITKSGPLVQATLSLRVADLHPVESELRFRDETVRITELPDAEPSAPPVPAPPSVPRSEPVPVTVGPSDELHAIAALHDIGADLGEPIEVTRREREVVVTASGLTPEREQQLRESLAAVPGAVVQSEDPQTAGRRAPHQAAQARTPADELANQILEASDAALARAFALDALASRFPPAVEANLPAADRALLEGMRTEHRQALETAAGRLDALLKAAWPETTAAPAQAEAANGRQLLEAARYLDQLLNRTFAGGAGPPRAEVLAALRLLQARAAGGPQ